MPENTTLVINWHVTERCNLRCLFCYAKWDSPPSPRDLILNQKDTDALLRELYLWFKPGNPANPLWAKMRWTKVRLNFAGGEPLLHRRRLLSVIPQARQIGFEVSLITNASLMTVEVAAELAPNLTWLGISLDSVDATTNRVIGRTDERGNLIDLDALVAALGPALARHPQLKLKINTVVNKANCHEDFSAVIARFCPDKWKVLRVLPVLTDALAISDEEFRGFVARHRRFGGIMCAEDNVNGGGKMCQMAA